MCSRSVDVNDWIDPEIGTKLIYWKEKKSRGSYFRPEFRAGSCYSDRSEEKTIVLEALNWVAELIKT